MAKSWPVKVAFMKCASACSTALALVILLAALSRGFALDLNKAVVVYPPNLSTPERKAITMLVEEVEKRMIQLALAKTGGHQTKAAELLAVWRPRLSRRIKALGLGGDEPDAEGA